MASSLTQYPLLIALLVAIFGVCLIYFGLVSPDPGSDQATKAPREQLQQRHQRALAALRRSGVSGPVDIVDFGDGLGLGVTQNVEAGAVLLRVPESMALDVGQSRSCVQGEHDEATLACQVERAVASAVASNELSRLSGLIVLLLAERRRGLLEGFDVDAVTDVLTTLPELTWQRENGMFAVDEDEFRIFGTGTSMEGWRDAAMEATAVPHMFMNEKLPQMGEVSMDEVRWAYLMLQWHAQWAEEGASDIPAGLELPLDVRFLWPLFLARPTPEWQHGVRLRHNQDAQVYEVLASHPMRSGDEVHFVDRRLSDASVLCFQGLWLTARHRMRLSLNVSSARRDDEAMPILQEYGCASQPLHLYVMQQKSVDNKFMSCMRMIALAANATRLRRAIKKGWLERWPVTGMVDQRTEATATELGIGSLQQVLNRLGSSSAQMRQRYGGDTAAARPTVHVREAETMIVVGLLKSMKELQLVSSSEYLFEALRESETGKADSGQGRR